MLNFLCLKQTMYCPGSFIFNIHCTLSCIIRSTYNVWDGQKIKCSNEEGGSLPAPNPMPIGDDAYEVPLNSTFFRHNRVWLNMCFNRFWSENYDFWLSCKQRICAWDGSQRSPHRNKGGRCRKMKTPRWSYIGRCIVNCKSMQTENIHKAELTGNVIALCQRVKWGGVLLLAFVEWKAQHMVAENPKNREDHTWNRRSE